jgi:uncharacterized protein with ACT and thioredoxin-like domain
MKALVLAGSLMGGDIERAVREVRTQGLMVVRLNMAGSVPAASRSDDGDGSGNRKVQPGAVEA